LRPSARAASRFNASFTAATIVAYVVDRSGKIRLAYVDANYATRLEPQVMMETLRSL
jgi:hypothetical protein